MKKDPITPEVRRAMINAALGRDGEENVMSGRGLSPETLVWDLTDAGYVEKKDARYVLTAAGRRLALQMCS